MQVKCEGQSSGNGLRSSALEVLHAWAAANGVSGEQAVAAVMALGQHEGQAPQGQGEVLQLQQEEHAKQAQHQPPQSEDSMKGCRHGHEEDTEEEDQTLQDTQGDFQPESLQPRILDTLLAAEDSAVGVDLPALPVEKLWAYRKCAMVIGMTRMCALASA